MLPCALEIKRTDITLWSQSDSQGKKKSVIFIVLIRTNMAQGYIGKTPSKKDVITATRFHKSIFMRKERFFKEKIF